MTEAEKKQKLASYLVSKGIFDPAQIDAEIAKMAETYPAAKAAEEGLTSNVEKAYAALTVSEGAPTGTTAASTQPTATLSSEDKSFINSKLREESKVREVTTRSTSISKLLFSKPAPDTYFNAQTKGTINVEAFEKIVEKVNKGEYEVLPDTDDFKSQTNYNTLVAASKNAEGTPLAVHIGKMAGRPVGYIVSTIDTTSNGAKTVQMTRDEFEKFLILQTNGYVLAGTESDPGAALRYLDPKTTANGTQIEARTVVVDKNRKSAIESGKFDITQQAGKGTKSGSAKSEISFQVYVNANGARKLKANGDPVVRTIRATLKVSVPEFEVKPAYTEKFEVKVNSNWTEAPNAKQMQAIRDAQVKAIGEMAAKFNQGSADIALDAYADDIAKFIKPAAQAPTVNV